MLNLLFLIPSLPFIGFFILIFFCGKASKSVIAFVGAGSIGLAALITILIGVEFLSGPPAGNSFTQSLWVWMSIGNFRPEIAFRLDPLSLLMIFVVTFVGFFIHLYSTEFM